MPGLVAAVVICSWLAISNHCALAAIATRGDAAQSECPFHHSKPAKPEPQPAGIQCCKVLRAIVATAAKSWARDDASFSDVDLTVDEFCVLADSHNAEPLLLDTGPPGAHSFAEIVLQRSLLVHAPPFFAQV